MQGARAAERHQGIVTGIMAALDRNGANSAHHISHDDIQHTVRRAFEREADALGNRLHGLPRHRHVKWH